MYLTASLKAVDQLLVGLPISLYDGFISGVTARIPFPNPLSSNVGFHVQSLNLTFQIVPEQPVSPASSFFDGSSNLADSVVSVAGTFIHDELTPREGAALRQTLRPSADSSLLVDESENLPGGFNPCGYNAEEAHKEPRGDDDPAGVSVFATLIERLLAKFEFSAVDTKVTIVYPGRASITLSVSEITYHTDQSPRSETNSGLQSASGGNSPCGQIRTISISGLKVKSRNLSVIASSPPVTSTLSPVSFTSSRKSSPLHYNPSIDQLSRNSSSSSLDEDTQFMMSQSIAMLPPSSLHVSSASSSMYQSTVSTAHAQPVEVDITTTPSSTPQITDYIENVGQARPHPQISIPCQDAVEDVLLSFGSKPIIFSLQTPCRRTQPCEQIPQADGDRLANPEGLDKPEQETLKFSVVAGTLACAFRSDHLRVLLDIMDACVPKLSAPSSASRKGASSELPRATLHLEANVAIRGIVIIALPEPATGKVLSLDAFYERPHVPPRLPCTYLRLFLDALSISSRLSTPSTDLSVSGVLQTPSMPVNQSISAKLVVSDMSLFTFHAVSSVDDSQVAAPIMITDPHLPTLHVARHYRPSLASERPKDIRLPEFEVVDWTKAKLKSGSAKLSTWRLRNRAVSGKADKSYTPSQRLCDLPDSPNPFIPSPLSEVEDKLPLPPAIEASGRLALPFPSNDNPQTVDVKMAPFHFFFDLGMTFKDDLLIHFIEDIASAAIFTPRKATDIAETQSLRQQSLGKLSEDDMDAERDIQIQQTSLHAKEREEARKRLEALVLEDFNLGTNYQRIGTSRSKLSRQQPALLKRKVDTLSHLLLSSLKIF